MELKLFILLILTGVVPVILPVPRKYYLIQNETTWSEAQVYCRAHHVDLATVSTAEDLTQIQKEAQEHGFTGNAWIGLYKDGVFYWSLRNETLGQMTVWNLPGLEPDNRQGMEDCVTLYDLTWWDRLCNEVFPFICYDETKTDTNRYILYTSPKTWYEAQTFCRQFHTDLTSVRDQTELNNVAMRIFKISWTWIGLYRGIWRWSDRSIASNLTWAPEQPDNGLGMEYCGALSSGQIMDEQCSNVKPSFCYSVITGQHQIVRLEIQTDLDGNDPAVMSATLEKIKLKLAEHKVTKNISVKWREQPDGKVFHKIK